MKIYLEYLKYLLEHKKNVFIECWERGLYIHAFIHDLSKFHPKEFKHYAWWFHSGLGVKYKPENSTFTMQDIIDAELRIHKSLKSNFKKAWQHHKDHNKHHWNYWHERKLPMPNKYIIQMICDWKAMSRKFGDTARDYYSNNYDNIKLDMLERKVLNYELKFADKNLTISTTEIKDIFKCKISSYLQGGYGIMLISDYKYIGYIDFVTPNGYLGDDIIIKDIVIYNDELQTKLNRSLYRGLMLTIDDDENIW